MVQDRVITANQYKVVYDLSIGTFSMTLNDPNPDFKVMAYSMQNMSVTVEDRDIVTTEDELVCMRSIE